MNIAFSPVRSDDCLYVSLSGDVLVINGQSFDFTNLLEGAALPAAAIASAHFTEQVQRIEGELHLTLRLPHGQNPSPAVAFPEPITVTTDGPIQLPTDEGEAND